MPGPKKPSAFMLFVEEYRKKNREASQMSISEVVALVSKQWNNMTEQAKGTYKAAAKEASVQRAQSVPLNCRGQPLTHVEMEERRAEEEQLQMKRMIDKMVSEALNKIELINAEFCFVSFNYFMKSQDNNTYMPAEFSACKFSLETGIKSKYLSHINPGQGIFGQASNAVHHANTTHQLPLPPNAQGESDLPKLYSLIIKYLKGPDNKKKQPDDKQKLYVFTTAELVPVVKSCFRFLEIGSQCDYSIEVYEIEYLFFKLTKAAMESEGMPTDRINKFVTDSIFAKDSFEYHSGMACEFHEKVDRSKYCTHSMVTRWCYMFCDRMCQDLAIKMIPGKHMPHIGKPNLCVLPQVDSEMDTSTASFFSIASDKDAKKGTKPEAKNAWCKPMDHTTFSGDIEAENEFPDLSGRKNGKKQKKNDGSENGRSAFNNNTPNVSNAWDKSNFDM